MKDIFLYLFEDKDSLNSSQNFINRFSKSIYKYFDSSTVFILSPNKNDIIYINNEDKELLMLIDIIKKDNINSFKKIDLYNKHYVHYINNLGYIIISSYEDINSSKLDILKSYINLFAFNYINLINIEKEKKINSNLKKINKDMTNILKKENNICSEKIKNPLNTILGFLELLKEEDLTNKQTEYLDYINQSSLEIFNYLNNSSNNELNKDLDSNLSILLVDDVEANLLLLKNMILNINTNFNILTSNSAHEAIDIIKTNTKFDLVFMDIQMPEMDGYEAIDIIKTDPSIINKPLKFIAITANNSSEERAFSQKSGIDYFLTKPVSKKDLLNIIELEN